MAGTCTRIRLLTIVVLITLVGAAAGRIIDILLQQQDGSFLAAITGKHSELLPVPDRVAELSLDRRQMSFKNPLGIVITPDGKLIVADAGNHRIVVMKPSGELIAQFGAFGSGTDQFNYPVALAVNRQADRVYIADFNNSRIQVWDLNTYQYLYSLPDKAGVQQHGPLQPVAVAVDREDILYVSDVIQQRIVVFDQVGNYLHQFGSSGSEPGQLFFANGLAVDDRQDLLYAADTNNGRLQVFTKQGKLVETIVHMGPQQILVTPRGIALDQQQDVLYIADTITNRIYLYQFRTKKIGIIGGQAGSEQLSFPNSLTLDHEGKLYVTDRGNNQVVVFRYGSGRGEGGADGS